VDTGEWMPGPMTPLPNFFDWWGMICFFFGHFNIMLDVHGYWADVVKVSSVDATFV